MNQFKKVSIEEAAKPKEGLCFNYVDRWWLVTADRSILLWGRSESPQCNPSRAVCEHLKANDEHLLGEPLQVEQLPFVSLSARAAFW